MSSDPERIEWPDGGSPAWWGRPEHTCQVRALKERVAELAATKKTADDSELLAVQYTLQAAMAKAAYDTLGEDMETRLEELDLIDRRIHFELNTSLMRLNVRAIDYKNDELPHYLENSPRTSYFTNETSAHARILDIVALPEMPTQTGLIVAMPNGEACFMPSTADGFIVGDKDPDR